MANPLWLIIPVSALIVKQYNGVSEYSQTSSYLACAMLSVSPQPPRGFRASLEQATNGNLCTTASPQWPHFFPNRQPKNSFLFKPLCLKNDHLFTSDPRPPEGSGSAPVDGDPAKRNIHRYELRPSR